MNWALISNYWTYATPSSQTTISPSAALTSSTTFTIPKPTLMTLQASTWEAKLFKSLWISAWVVRSVAVQWITPQSLLVENPKRPFREDECVIEPQAVIYRWCWSQLLMCVKEGLSVGHSQTVINPILQWGCLSETSYFEIWSVFFM